VNVEKMHRWLSFVLRCRWKSKPLTRRLGNCGLDHPSRNRMIGIAALTALFSRRKELKGGETHPLTGKRHYSITFRKAA
jgi:hypothetical protein